jgi:hypothetical protein
VLLAWLVFATAFALYVRTLVPGLTWGDAGELVAAAHTLGLAHPPGSPLYLILAKVASLVPIGSIAFRINLLSALAAASAVAALYLLVRDLLRLAEPATATPGLPRAVSVEVPAAGAALAFAATPTLWAYAIVAEVYTLQLLFVVMSMACGLRWLATEEPSCLGRAWLFAGLGLAVHPAGLFALPGLGYLLWRARCRRPGLRPLLGPLCLVLPGLALYLYVPLRALADPMVDWGFPRTLGEILAYLTASQYRYDGGPLGRPSVATLVGSALSHLTWPVREFAGLLIPVVALGAGVCVQRYRAAAIFTALVAGGTSLGPLASPSFDASRDGPAYFLPLYAVMAIWLGLGLQWVLARGVREAGPVFRGVAWRSVLAGGLIVMVIPGLVGLRGYPAARGRQTDVPPRLARFLLDEVKPGAVILAQDDDVLFPLWYVQQAENHRKDVAVLPIPWLGLYPRQIQRRYPDLIVPPGGKAGLVEAFLLANAGRRPLYVVGAPEGSGSASARLIPRGVLFEFGNDVADREAHRRALARFEMVVLGGESASLDRGTALVMARLYGGIGRGLASRGWADEGLRLLARAAALPGLSRAGTDLPVIAAQAGDGQTLPPNTVGPSPAPTGPEVLTPAEGARIPVLLPTMFSWTSFGGAQAYFFEYTGPGLSFTNPRGTAQDPINGVPPRGSAFVWNATSFIVALDPAVPAGTYQFRIAALDAMGRFIGTFSDARTVNVEPLVMTGGPTIVPTPTATPPPPAPVPARTPFPPDPEGGNQ